MGRVKRPIAPRVPKPMAAMTQPATSSTIRGSVEGRGAATEDMGMDSETWASV